MLLMPRLALLMSCVMLLMPRLTQQVSPSTRPHVTASLAPFILRVPDGRRFLDVNFAIEKGWHMSWRNPGDSGGPPKFEWSLPTGWSAGEPIFPVPNHLPEDEDILAFQDSLRLLVPLTVPTTWTGEAASVRLSASWMTCNEICVVERQTVQSELVERAGAMPGGYPEAAPAALVAMLRGSGADRTLVIDASALAATARWFPDACPGVRFPSERMLPMPGGRIEVPVRIREGDAPDGRPVVRGMVEVVSSGGVRVFDLAVPATAPAAK